MTYGEFKSQVLATLLPGRSADDLNDPSIDSRIKSAIHRALLRIAKETLPLRLRTESDDVSILRKIDERTRIRVPYEVYSDDDDIDIDTALLNAVGYHVASELEPQRKGHFLQQYEREIIQNNSRLIETDLDWCDDVSRWEKRWL